MFVIRDIFQLKFGKAREARESLKQLREINEQMGFPQLRVLTDFTGESYRLIMESEFPTLAEYERQLTSTMATPEWREGYTTFIPLIESSYREILRLVD